VAESLPISNYVKIMAIWPDLVLAIERVADQQVSQVLQWPLSSTKQVEKHALCTLSQPDNVLRQTSILGVGFCCLILVAQACWFHASSLYMSMGILLKLPNINFQSGYIM
jgi:hypothetical protein